MPVDHQSTLRPWPLPSMISGAMYSMVPMKLLVLQGRSIRYAMLIHRISNQSIN
jgi:hypothetical protein